MQAFGAKKYALVGFIWQRAVLIMGLLCIPISVLLLFAEPILLATRQTPEVAAMTASYIRQEAFISFGLRALNPFSLFVLHAHLQYLRGAAVLCCAVPFATHSRMTVHLLLLIVLGAVVSCVQHVVWSTAARHHCCHFDSRLSQLLSSSVEWSGVHQWLKVTLFVQVVPARSVGLCSIHHCHQLPSGSEDCAAPSGDQCHRAGATCTHQPLADVSFE